MDELKQLQAAAYVLGDLENRDLLNFEEAIDQDSDLASFVGDLHEVSAALLRVAPNPRSGSHTLPVMNPSPDLFDRISAKLDARHHLESSVLEESNTEGMVVTDREGRIIWVNDAFTHMCGHELPDITGRKPGHFLQGPMTDPVASNSMRRAVKGGYGCIEELINYHKNGDPYWVRITITPVLDEQGQTSRFIALEKKLENRPIPVAA